ncbi:MAG: DUF4214 domain-containing protein [Clostridia bacterium]|nr:DUF4214 domain-containing protein [Clostridia bacterium]
MNSFKLKIFTLLFSALMIILIYPSLNITADNSGPCGENLTWELDDEGNVTITGSGNLCGLSGISKSDIVTVTIPNTVTHIDPYMFSGCYNLKSVTLPDSITKIEYGTFERCNSLKEITIPKSVTAIDPIAFQYCTNLEKVVFEYDTTGIYLADASFEACTNLKTIISRKPINTRWDYSFDLVKDYSVYYYYNVSYSECEYGSITGNTLSYGTDLLQVLVQPEEDYELDYIIWDNGLRTENLYPTSEGQFLMPDSDTDVQLSAVFKKAYCTVKFMCEDDPNPLQKTQYSINSHPKYNMSEPTKEPTEDKIFKFSGWKNGEKTYGKDEELPELTEAVTYYAVFESLPRPYKICFLNEDGTELQSDMVKYGEIPSYTGETPTKEKDDMYTYTFAGWSPEITSVTGDTTYTATYSRETNEYEIKFVNEDGTELQSDMVEYDQTPTYNGETPTKEKDDKYTYTFDGWSPEITSVTGDATYTATYTGEINEYEIKFVNEDGTELQVSMFQYDQTPSYSGETPTKKEDDKYTYTFDGWTPEITSVTGDATYTAKFSANMKVAPPTNVPEPTPNPEVIASFEAFVERLYEVALGRESDPDGKAYWAGQVINGNLTGADCIRAFLLSEEFNNRNLSDEEFVTVLYKALFDRDAVDDPEGFNFWMNSLKTVGRENVVDGFINSTEWCNVCASYGVKSGATRAKATIASKNATDFATRLYTECLGREPDAEGLAFWSLALTNLDITGTEAAHEFFYSAEFNGFNLSNTELVTKMYKTLLGREADSEGLSFWVENMDNGMTKDQLFENFSTSPEFTGICVNYAIDR